MKYLSATNTTNKAIVDDEDYVKCSKLRWFCVHGHVKTEVDNNLVDMARIVLNDFSSPVIDHKDLNPFNNQKSNLRPATHAQNHHNRTKRRGKLTSQYKGVSWRSDRSVWRATIVVDKKQIFLGTYSNQVAAAKAYDRAAKTYFGIFARLNFPEVEECA